MAEEASKKLDEQLNCAICLDVYTDPKLLQCHHVYCRKCLVKLVIQDEQGQLCLTCPTCRKVTSIPENGVSGLQSAFHINRLLEIRDSLTKIKNSTISVETVKSEVTSNHQKERPVFSCSEHPEKELELYCESCEELICLKCVTKGGRHPSHVSVTLDVANDKCQGEITSSLEPIEKQLMSINSALAKINTRCEEISKKQANIEDEISLAFRKLHKTLDVRKNELINQLHFVTQTKIKDLDTQRDQLNTTQAQLNSCLEAMRENLKGKSPMELLMMKKSMKKVNVLTSPFLPDILRPNAQADTAFSDLPADIVSLCSRYGRITLAPDPSKCYIVKEFPNKVKNVGEVVNFICCTMNFINEPCEESVNMECELVSEITGSTVRGSVERRGKNQYEISYKPVIKGKHQLSIKINGHHIRGSPFFVSVESHIPNSIKTISIANPVRIVIHQNRDIIATSGTKHCVTIFSPSGNKRLSFGKHGSSQGQFDYPCGVTVDGAGHILVADNNNHRIQKFTASGQFLTAVGIQGNRPLQFSFPWGIAYNATNDKIYVADKNNHRIQVLNSDLTFYTSFETAQLFSDVIAGTRAGTTSILANVGKRIVKSLQPPSKHSSNYATFTLPFDIACDNTGKVYITHDDNHCIQVCSMEGKPLWMLGRYGQGRGELDNACGIAAGGGDRVYVSELENHRMSVFKSEGQFLTSFGRKGSEPGEFHAPVGLAVDSDGVIYVCDLKNNRIQLL